MEQFTELSREEKLAKIYDHCITQCDALGIKPNSVKGKLVNRVTMIAIYDLVEQDGALMVAIIRNDVGELKRFSDAKKVEQCIG